jgi:hypothetical protein
LYAWSWLIGRPMTFNAEETSQPSLPTTCSYCRRPHGAYTMDSARQAFSWSMHVF